MTAAEAVPSPTITLSAYPNPVSAGDNATITVTVSPGLTNENVTLETKTLGLIWTQVTASPTNSPGQLGADGTVQFQVKQAINGWYSYRAKVAANANHTAGTSATFSLHVVTNATPQTQPGVYSCAGEAPPASIPRPGGGSWQCMYNDEFTGTSLDTTYWSIAQQGLMTQPKVEPACMGNESTGNVAVSGGQLHLTATVLASPAPCPEEPGNSSRKFGALVYHNVPDGTSPTLAQTYGYYEVRAKLPTTMHGVLEGQANGTRPDGPEDLPANWDAVPGLQETFYLWPSSERYGFWPHSGEMDFAEFYSGAGNLMNPSMHDGYDVDGGGWTKPHCNILDSYGGDADGFNTYRFLWTPTVLKTWVNDNPNPCTSTDHSGPPFDKGFYLALIQAFGTTSTENAYVLTPGAKTVGTTDIEYVRVWQ